MKRVVTENHISQITLRNGRTVERQKDGTFHMGDRQAAAAVKGGGGYIVPDMNTATSRAEGYRCVNCGFGTWFKTCSRCGGECFRETDA